MTNEKLRQLALDFGELLKKYDVDFHKYAITVAITEEYYQKIKETVKSDAPVGLEYFNEYDNNWSITLARPMQIGKLSDNEQD